MQVRGLCGVRAGSGVHLRNLRGTQLEHGGDIYGNKNIELDFSVNLSPIGPPQEVCRLLKGEDWTGILTNYPDPEYRELRKYLRTFSNRTIWNIFWSANNYEIPKHFPDIDTEIQFWVGTCEWGSRFRDLKWYQKYIPDPVVYEIYDARGICDDASEGFCKESDTVL